MNSDSATLVLLPCLIGTTELFGWFLSALADKKIPADRCLALPLPTAQPQDYPSLAEHISKSLPDGDIILLAESFSTPLAMMLAESHRNRVRGMILVVGFCESPLPTGIALLPLRPLFAINPPVPLVEHFLTGDMAPPGCLEAAMETLRKADSRVIASRVRTVLYLRESDCPAPRDLPVLLIQATKDRIIPWEAQSRLERHLPNARVVWIDGPHMLLQTEAHACAAAVASFLDDL